MGLVFSSEVQDGRFIASSCLLLFFSPFEVMYFIIFSAKLFLFLHVFRFFLAITSENHLESLCPLA